MKTRKAALYVALCALSQCAVAQNLLQNPSFDNDLSPWQGSASSVWSTLNHGSSDSGSLQMTTSSYATTSQCVLIAPNENYELAAWIEQDPLREFDPCPTPSWDIAVEWHSDAMCQTGNFAQPITSSDGPFPLDWYRNTFEVTAPQGAISARIRLSVSCGEQHGTSIFYFDDVSFTPDRVFHNDFEVHAGEGGPGQPQ